MHIVIALMVLFITGAVASTASAQPVCERVLFHVLPIEGCERESVTSFQLRKEKEAAPLRATRAQNAAREQAVRYYYGSHTDHIKFGDDPTTNMGTLHGRRFGREGQWDSWNYYGGRYGYYRGPDFAGNKHWILRYEYYGRECPDANTRPPNTAAPEGYEWKCKSGLDANYVAYVRKGRGHVLEQCARSETCPGGIVEKPKVQK